jgi:hypothetical protein
MIQPSFLRAPRPTLVAFLILIAFGLNAEGEAPRGASLAALLPADVVSLLASSGKAVRTSEGKLSLIPNHQAAADIRKAFENENPSLVVEAVFALQRPKPASAIAAQAELASVYGILRSLGSLEGIEYYSASRKKMRTFYAESYIIDGPESKVRLPDPKAPSAGAIPQSETVYAFQRDLSFGANRYRYEYAAFSDAIRLSSSNLTKMSYGIVPVAAPGELSTRLLVIQADDAILFYVASGAKAPGLFSGKLEDSFANRAEALFRWFSAKYSGRVFMK